MGNLCLWDTIRDRMAVDVAILAVAAAASATLGALVGGLLARRVARRQRFHEAKQRAYEKFLPQVQESISVLGAMHEVTTLDLNDDERFVGNATSLVGQLFALGGREGWETLDVIDELAEEDEEGDEEEETAENRREFLEAVRELVVKVFFYRLFEGQRELVRQKTVLSFAAPDPEVLEKLDEVISMFSGDWTGFGLRQLLSRVGLRGLFPDVDLQARATAFGEALKELKQAMEDDLRRTL